MAGTPMNAQLVRRIQGLEARLAVGGRIHPARAQLEQEILALSVRMAAELGCSADDVLDQALRDVGRGCSGA